MPPRDESDEGWRLPWQTIVPVLLTGAGMLVLQTVGGAWYASARDTKLDQVVAAQEEMKRVQYTKEDGARDRAYNELIATRNREEIAELRAGRASNEARIRALENEMTDLRARQGIINGRTR